ncbi:MAG: DUF4249 domain-containing protein [Chitinophagaceae bacterium]|nr:DUF4249 domain-containing protein [Chitinophagaceae bacterium]
MKKCLWPILIFFIFSGCEKDINFNLKNADNVLVVDAEIENDKYPTVVLTKSLDFFSTINPQLLEGSFVHNADVKISDGILTHTLKEVAVALPGGYTAYIYTIDENNMQTAFMGELNKLYNLKITSEGKEYTSTTQIPALAVVPDSIWFKPAPQNPDTNTRVMMGKVTDPVGLGNYGRYFTKKNNEPYLPGESSVFDDAVVDGKTYTVQVTPGIDRNNPPEADSNFFKKGDVVTVKFCNINKATYTFWSTWEFAYESIGNPFSQPNKVIGNISNGALGAFSGYAAWYKTIVAE